MVRRLSCAFALLTMVSATASGQGPKLDRVMRAKLYCSQKILEAVVTSRWAELETRSRELEVLTNDPAWTMLKAPEYARHSDGFRTAVRALREASAKRDLEATPKAYAVLITSCVECHRYLARSRLAGK